MPSHNPIKPRFNVNLDLTARLLLVSDAYLLRGQINRKILVDTYGVTQVQAGALMRNFIEANSKTIEWFPENTHYRLIEK